MAYTSQIEIIYDKYRAEGSPHHPSLSLGDLFKKYQGIISYLETSIPQAAQSKRDELADQILWCSLFPSDASLPSPTHTTESLSGIHYTTCGHQAILDQLKREKLEITNEKDVAEARVRKLEKELDVSEKHARDIEGKLQTLEREAGMDSTNQIGKKRKIEKGLSSKFADYHMSEKEFADRDAIFSTFTDAHDGPISEDEYAALLRAFLLPESIRNFHRWVNDCRPFGEGVWQCLNKITETGWMSEREGCSDLPCKECCERRGFCLQILPGETTLSYRIQVLGRGD